MMHTTYSTVLFTVRKPLAEGGLEDAEVAVAGAAAPPAAPNADASMRDSHHGHSHGHGHSHSGHGSCQGHDHA